MADRAEERKPERRPGVKAWMEGLEPLTIGIAPELKADLEDLAKRSGISLEEIASIFFNEKVARFEELKGSIEKTIKQALDKKYDELDQIVRALVVPSRETTEMLKDILPLIRGSNKKRFSD